MKRKLLSILSVLLLSSSMLFSNTLNANAAPAIMADGSIFDAEYYAQTNPDVVGVLGNDAAVLYNHYVSNGKAEGRAPHDPSLDVSALTSSAAYIAAVDATLRPTDSTYLQLKTALPGTYITFGTYEQDNNLKNGQEPIEWLVLENDGESLFVLSKYVLDGEVFSTAYDGYKYKTLPVTWETSHIRNWLNSTFLNTAFTAGEQARIQTSLLENEINGLLEHSTENVTLNPTLDKIFFLSSDEVTAYFPMQEVWYSSEGYAQHYDPLLRATATPYAIKRGVELWTEKSAQYCLSHGGGYTPIAYDVIGYVQNWALRTSFSETNIRNVGASGSPTGFRQATYDMGNRPAMRILIQ